MKLIIDIENLRLAIYALIRNLETTGLTKEQFIGIMINNKQRPTSYVTKNIIHGFNSLLKPKFYKENGIYRIPSNLGINIDELTQKYIDWLPSYLENKVKKSSPEEETTCIESGEKKEIKLRDKVYYMFNNSIVEGLVEGIKFLDPESDDLTYIIYDPKLGQSNEFLECEFRLSVQEVLNGLIKDYKENYGK